MEEILVVDWFIVLSFTLNALIIIYILFLALEECKGIFNFTVNSWILIEGILSLDCL